MLQNQINFYIVKELIKTHCQLANTALEYEKQNRLVWTTGKIEALFFVVKAYMYCR